MTKPNAIKALLLAAGLAVSGLAGAAEGGHLQQSGTDLGDKASLQRGAAAYMNYCAGCHSLQHLRYARLGEDLGLTEEQVLGNLSFAGAKWGDHIVSPMTPAFGEKAFGKAPPDLSLVARVRGPDWIYTYLKSFYLDESRPLGWNNSLFANASMPNPLWHLQGSQRPVFSAKVDTGHKQDGKPVMGCAAGMVEIDDACLRQFVIAQPGSQDPAVFDQTVRDITAFLEYAAEPAALKRQNIGVWALLFLALFTFMAWLLKREYWRDVH